jgi:hypothetical protein
MSPMFGNPQLEERFVVALENIASALQKQPKRPEKAPIKCYICEQEIKLRKRPDGDGYIRLNMDGTFHDCPGKKPGGTGQ